MKTRQEIADWCAQFIAQMFEIPLAEVYADAEFQSFGFDSTALVSFSAELEAWLGRELQPSALFEHPTIVQLADHICGLEA
jgi:acyl carrier protein